MRVIVPVIDRVNALPALRHVIGRRLGGEAMQVHLLHLQSRWRASAERTLGPARALLDRAGVPYTMESRAARQVGQALAVAARRVGAERVILGCARYASATRLAEDALIDKLVAAAPVPVSLVSGKEVSRLERYGIAVGLGATLFLLVGAA